MAMGIQGVLDNTTELAMDDLASTGVKLAEDAFRRAAAVEEALNSLAVKPLPVVLLA